MSLKDLFEQSTRNEIARMELEIAALDCRIAELPRLIASVGGGGSELPGVVALRASYERELAESRREREYCRARLARLHGFKIERADVQ